MERKILYDIQIQTTEAVKASAQLQQSIDKLKANQKDLNAEYKAGAISAEQYSIALTKNKTQVSLLTQEQRKYNREIENSNKANVEAEGSYNQLSAQYSLMKDQLNAMSLAQRKGTEEGRKLEAEAKAIYEQMNALQQATGKASLNVGNYEEAIRNVLGENTEFSNTLQGMQDKLKALQELMRGADVGSQAFKDANDEAGKLRVQIDQALGKVDEFGDREPKNPLKKAYEDAFEAATGLTSALELINLTSSENENVAELQAKATKAVAIAQNLQNLARAKGAIIDTAQIIKTKALTAAQAAYTAVVGTSTGVMKAFRIALAATGVGALVIGIGLLIANFDKVRAVVLKFIPGLQQVGDKVMGIVNAVTDFIGITSEAERKAAETGKKQIAALDKDIKQLEEDIEFNSKRFDKYTLDKKKAALDYNKTKKEVLLDETKNEIEKNRLIGLAGNKMLDEDKAANDERIKDEKEKNDKIIEENKKKNDELRKQQQEFKNQIKELENQIAEGNIEAIQDENARKLAEINKGEQDQLDALTQQYNEIKKLGKLSTEQEQLFATRRNQITSEAEKNRQDLFKQVESTTLGAQIKLLDEERKNQLHFNNLELTTLEEKNKRKLEIELEYQQNLLTLLKEQYSAGDAAQKQALNQQITTVQNAIAKIQTGLTDLETPKGESPVYNALGLTQSETDKVTATIQQVQQSFQQLGQIINSAYQVRLNQIATQYNAEEEAIQSSTMSEKAKERELEKLRKKRALEEYEIQKEQFIVNQALNITNTIIAGALAAINAVAQLGPVAGGIAAGLIAASTAASVAVIASQPPPPKPQFYEGGFTEMSGNPRTKSNKSNSQRDVHHNEYIVPWKVLKQGDALPHIAALESMRKGTFGTLGLRGFADGGFNTRNIENASMTAYDMANMVVSAVQNVQIVTKVTDINREQSRSVTNKVRAEI